MAASGEIKTGPAGRPLREKACLICIDGWGICQDENSPGDAIRLANTPIMSGFEQKYAYTKLAAHGLAVGLPEGLMGNSEVGHLNIGAGRVVYQVLRHENHKIRPKICLFARLG